MVEDIGHDDAAERVVTKWQPPCIQHDLDAATVKNVGRNEVRNELLQEASPGTDFENRSVSWYESRCQVGVPLFVNAVEEWLGLEDLPPLFSGSRVIQIKTARERMAQQVFAFFNERTAGQVRFNSTHVAAAR